MASPVRVLSAAFSPDGRWIVLVGSEKRVEVWDGSGSALLLSLGGDESVSSAAFSPDGVSLATVAVDGTVRLWKLPFETRGAQEIDALVRCRAPWRLEEGRLVPSEPDGAACP